MSVSSMRAELAVSRRNSVLSSVFSSHSEDPMDALFSDFTTVSSPCRNHSNVITASMFASSSGTRPAQSRYASSSSSSSCSSTASPSQGPLLPPPHPPMETLATKSLTPEEEDLMAQILEEDKLDINDAEDEYIMDRLLAREELLKSMADAKAAGKPRVFDWAMLYEDELATGGPLVEVVRYEPSEELNSGAVNWTELYLKEKMEAELEKAEKAKKSQAERADMALKRAWFGGNIGQAKSECMHKMQTVVRPTTSTAKSAPQMSRDASVQAWFGISNLEAPKPRFFPAAKSSPPKASTAQKSAPLPVASPRFQLSRSLPLAPKSEISSVEMPATENTRFARPDFRKLGARSEPLSSQKSLMPPKPETARVTNSGRFAFAAEDRTKANAGRKASKSSKRPMSVRTYTAAEYFK